jgi:hypothetical protein
MGSDYVVIMILYHKISAYIYFLSIVIFFQIEMSYMHGRILTISISELTRNL